MDLTAQVHKAPVANGRSCKKLTVDIWDLNVFSFWLKTDSFCELADIQLFPNTSVTAWESLVKLLMLFFLKIFVWFSYFLE